MFIDDGNGGWVFGGIIEYFWPYLDAYYTAGSDVVETSAIDGEGYRRGFLDCYYQQPDGSLHTCNGVTRDSLRILFVCPD